MANPPITINEKASRDDQTHTFDTPDAVNARARRKQRLIKHVLPAILTVLALFTLFRSAFVCNHHYAPSGHDAAVSKIIDEADQPKVELEAHGMSRCPDFRDCLRDLIVPTMIKVSDKINFTLSFIGRYVIVGLHN